MKKIDKILLSIIISIFVYFIYPINISALEKQTSYVNINDTQSLKIENLSFSNISFKDFSSTSTQAFGISGVIKNDTNNSINYNSTVYYYDSNYNLITQESRSGIARAGTNSYSQMSNLSILKEHNVSEIYYYRLSVEIIDNLITNEQNITPSEISKYSSYDYVIDKYDVNIIVNENNTLDITETITAYFNIPKHGIFRIIPLKNTVTRLDGTTSTNRVQIKNIDVNNKYKISKGRENYKIQIGSANSTLIGEQKYVIKYTYNLGKDPINEYDELYYNIIGNEWDTVIGNVTFSITMPKQFDQDKLGLSSGIKGSTNNSKIKYNVDETKITGNYEGILNVGEALTIRCELPEGYFVNAGFLYNSVTYLMFIIPILGLIITFILWYIFGRDNQVIETVEFYPPEGLNSLDVGFLYKGKVTNKDITSLLIFLANKGYIEINDKRIDLNSEKININEESRNNLNKKIAELKDKINEERKTNPESKKIKYYENMLDIYNNIDKPIDYEQYGLKSSVNKYNKNNNFVIKKLKDYDGNDINEKLFMNGLFEDDNTEVTDKMLYNKFYITNNRILHSVNSKKNKEKIFEKNTLKKLIIILLMAISIITTIAIPMLEYAGFEELAVILFLIAVYIPFFAVGIFVDMPIVFRIFWLGFTFIHSCLFFSALPLVEAITSDTIYILGVVVGLICLIGMIILLRLMPKRTKYGIEILGKLKGFKNFLEVAEKEKLETMVLQNPNYFYDILPYAYVLGVSDKWIKKFEFISMKSPSWYDSTSSFDVSNFETFINSTMTSAESVMTSSPSSDFGSSSSSDSSSGSSGGGSSGGGSGGGGGGSW